MAKVGRNRLFATPEEFEDAAEEYFASHSGDGDKITWTGLCLAVGADCRQTLDKYKDGTYGPDFVGPVKRALMRVENWYEEHGQGAMQIFALKNFAWKDQQNVAVGQDADKDALKWVTEVVHKNA